MITLVKYGALSGGEKYNVNVMSIDGLSTDTKPTDKIDGMAIPNGSIYTEIDTGTTYMYDSANVTWYEVSIGGGGVKPEGGIILVGETTTALTDGATTNPIVVDGQSYTAQPNDAVLYGNKEFLFTGTRWREFGDLSGLNADMIDDANTTNKFVTTSEKTTWNDKQNALNQTQMNAVNSGITSADVTQITTNENNISTVSDANGTKNLLDFNDWASKVNTTRATKSISGNSITLTATGNDAYTDGVATTCPASGKIACEPNTTYVITWETTSTSTYDNVYIFPANASPYYRAATTKYIEYTMPAGCQYFTFRFGVANSGDTVTYSNIMICEKSLYDISNQYKPYALSNAELTTKEKQNEYNISTKPTRYIIDTGQRNTTTKSFDISTMPNGMYMLTHTNFTGATTKYGISVYMIYLLNGEVDCFTAVKEANSAIITSITASDNTATITYGTTGYHETTALHLYND